MSAEVKTRAPYAPGSFFARAKKRLSPEPFATDGRLLEQDLNPPWPDWPPPDIVLRDAAVLIPIVDRQPEPSLILTQRTSHLASHAGQVAFPGGKIDPTDAGPAAAALREAEEEIGLDRALVEPIGYLETLVTASGYRITPLVGRVPEVHRLEPNPHEVESVFEVPLSFLMEPANHSRGTREWRGYTRHFYDIPFGEYRIWGITAGIIRRLYEKLFD